MKFEIVETEDIHGRSHQEIVDENRINEFEMAYESENEQAELEVSSQEDSEF